MPATKMINVGVQNQVSPSLLSSHNVSTWYKNKVHFQIIISFTMLVNGWTSWMSATSFQDKSISSRGALTIGASMMPSKSWLRPNVRLVKNFAARLAKVSAAWMANATVTLQTAIVLTLSWLLNSMDYVLWIPFVTMIAKEVSRSTNIGF